MHVKLVKTFTLSLAIWVTPHVTRAQGEHGTNQAKPEPATPEPNPSPSYWAGEHPRWHLAGTAALGAYAWLKGGFGYGVPHHQFVALEAEAVSTTTAAATRIGLRGALPFVELLVAGRRTWSYSHEPLPVQASHDSLDAPGSPASYTNLDVSLWSGFPVPLGYATVEFDLVLLDTPDGRHLYEEYLVTVVDSGATTDLRLGYLFSFAEDRVLVGPFGEWLHLAGRDASLWRIGPGFFWKLGPHLDILVQATTPLAGPDDLPFIEGLYGTGILRYRFATGERQPGWP